MTEEICKMCGGSGIVFTTWKQTIDHPTEPMKIPCPQCTIEIPKNLLTHEDMVNHPKHYTSSNAVCECGKTIECIDIVRHMNFNLGNVIKYVWRHNLKDGLEGLKKARWYLDDEIRQLEKELNNGTKQID